MLQYGIRPSEGAADANTPKRLGIAD